MRSHLVLHPRDLHGWLVTYPVAHLDIGCGDGSAALDYAHRHPDTAVLSLDICLDNLSRKLRRAPDNLRFLQADATAPPGILHGQFDSGTIAFPFGSLLRALLGGNRSAIERILSPFKPQAPVRVLVNESAIRTINGPVPEIPSTLELLRVSLNGARVTMLDHVQIRQEPSRWARRIGYGRPSKTWLIAGKKVGPVCAATITPHEHPLTTG